MVSILSKDKNSLYCEFAYDDWATDGDNLPRIGVPGKGVLSTVKSCSQGSFAIGTDGTVKILNGDSNEWVDY